MSSIEKFGKIPEGSIHLVVTGGALATSFILPHGEIDGLRLCPIYHVTGIECPFCGMTRGFVAMSHFDPVAAIEFNLGTPLVYVAFLAIMFRSLWSWKNNRLSNQPEFPKSIIAIWTITGIVTFGYLLYERWIFPFINL